MCMCVYVRVRGYTRVLGTLELLLHVLLIREKIFSFYDQFAYLAEIHVTITGVASFCPV